MLLYVGMFSGFSVSSCFFGSYLTTFLTALHFPFEQFRFGFRFSETSLLDLFWSEPLAPACSATETFPSSICFRYSLLLLLFVFSDPFKRYFPLLFPLDFSLCFIPSDGKPGTEPQLVIYAYCLLLFGVEPFRIYLYIGITSCDYKISQCFSFFNMEYCIKHTSCTCIKYRFPPNAHIRSLTSANRI